MVDSLKIQIALEGDAEVKAKIDGVATSFEQATKSIAALGSTGTEALGNAAAAAQKLGASQQDLQKVESIINVLNARSRDSSKSFTELAGAYDKARQSAGSFAAASEKVAEATKTTSKTLGETRSAVNALAQGLNELGLGPLGRLVSTIEKVGTRLGALAVAIGAVAGGAAALIKFATAAEDTEKALTQLQKVSGQSFSSLSALATVFAKGGTSVKQFATAFGNLSEKIASAGEAAAKQGAIKQQAENAAKGLKVEELGAITLDERVKALLGTLSRVPPTEQWFALADIFKQLKDTGNDLEAVRLGQALVLPPEAIASLSQGSEKLQQLAAEADRLGLTLTSSNQQALQEMATGWNQFTSLVSALFQKIGVAAAPAFTAILESFKPVLQGIVSDFENMPLDQAIANLGTRLVPAFETLGTTIIPVVTASGTAVGTAFADAFLAAIKDLIPQSWEALWNTLLQDFAKFGESLVQNAQILGEKIKRALGSGGGGGAAPASGGGGKGLAGGGFIGGSGTGTSDSNLAWVSRGEHIMPASVVRQPGVLSLLEALRRGGNLPGFAAGGQAAARGASNYTIVAEGLFDTVLLPIADSLQQIIESLRGIQEKILRAASGHASGGLLGGSGTGTSDSNLAWVSRGEYITPARAVGQPGVLAFLEALRRSGGNLTAVLNGMGQFALGGMVRMPAFAAGGLAGGSNVTIQFPGLPAIGGLRASADVVDQLHRAAAQAQVRSGGRKPSRYS